MLPIIRHPKTTQRVLDRIGQNQFPDFKKIIATGFQEYEPLYPRFQKIGTRKYNRLRNKIARKEKTINQGKPPKEQINLYTSRHKRIETKWYLNLTADIKGFRNQWRDSIKSLKDIDQPQSIAWQNPEDGAFGSGYNMFHLQCDAMIDAIGYLYNDGDSTAPEYPLDFLAPINTGEKITEYLTPLITSNLRKTGINHRDQIGAITGSMSQLVYKSYLRDYVNTYVDGLDITDEYKEAYTKFLDGWQDPTTGFWGAWFDVDGEILKSPDLSLTYHTVKYRKGKINHWEELIDTLLAIKTQPYPFGWSVQGHMNNHNSMDVVRIMKLGWEHMTEDQKESSVKDIEEMLDWCLNDSLEPDGTFRYFSFYNSQGDAFYYGVAFLDAVGYINPDNLFWTNKTFPEGKDLCLKIKKRLIEMGLDNSGAQNALEILNRDCPCNQEEKAKS
ncbi:hypothetical protein [Curvivirga sp.]|uniref:hypothetical protein n=1 Tax=Curvivirga sp. TaxID=2856848 RepID=UPI003B58DAD6